jgi:signal transduction histidine kinase
MTSKNIHIKNPKLASIIVFFCILLLSQLLVYQQYQLSENKLHVSMQKELILVKDKLNVFLKSSFVATKRLAFIIENYGIPKDFNKIGEHFLSNNKNIDAIELTQKGVITHVYPYQGNESVIGYDILKDTFTRKEAIQAIVKNELYFAGPFKLKQGGKGIVGRTPIVKNGKFWGFAVVLVKLDNLTKSIGIDSIVNEKYTFQLAKKNPNTHNVEYFINNTFPLEDKHTKSFYIPEGEWTIYIHANKGGNALYLFILSFVGILFSLASAYLTYYFGMQPMVLQKLVDEKTALILETENLLSSSLDRMSDSFMMLDRNWRYTFLNSAALSTHPDNKENIIGKTIWEVHPNLIGTAFEAAYREAMSSLKSSEMEGYYEPFESYFYIKIYPSTQGLTIIYSDITKQKEAKEELELSYQNIRKLNNHLNTIREEERTSIAREIHDELGQQLTALKMDTYWFSKKIDANDKATVQKVSEMLQLIDQTIHTVRRIASDLRPGILDDLGLCAALEWQSSEMEKHSGINIKFMTDLDKVNIDKNKAIGIFRIYQEALTNIIRHAKTPSVLTNLELKDNQLILRIEDFGVGFNLAEVKLKNSFGLSGMSERALMMSGYLQIESSPNQGTVILLTVPL